MSSGEEDYLYDCTDSGNESPEGDDDDDGIGMEMGLGMEDEAGPSTEKQSEEEYHYEVLTTEQIVEHMVDSIKDVNNVIQIPATTVRILLNHFKWDKEKLMEKFYSDHQDQMFADARVVSPFNKKQISKTPKSISVPPKCGQGSQQQQTNDCEICYLNLPIAVREVGVKRLDPIQANPEQVKKLDSIQKTDESQEVQVKMLDPDQSNVVFPVKMVDNVESQEVKMLGRVQPIAEVQVKMLDSIKATAKTPEVQVEMLDADQSTVGVQVGMLDQVQANAEIVVDPLQVNKILDSVQVTAESQVKTLDLVHGNSEVQVKMLDSVKANAEHQEVPVEMLDLDQSAGVRVKIPDPVQANEVPVNIDSVKATAESQEDQVKMLGPVEANVESQVKVLDPVRATAGVEVKMLDPVRATAEVKILGPVPSTSGSADSVSKPSDQNKMMTGLECGHLYCTSCWVEYLTTKIMDEGASQSIECPSSNCDILVDDLTVMKLVKDAKVKLKYQHLITNSFVQCNRLMRWCSAPDCNYAAKVLTVESKPIKCKCGHVFCFSCSENWHDPVRCHLIKKWIKKCDDDSETSNWISANTKECPKCNATIEKDGGCNHMICKNQSCKADFCWVCLGPWEPHGSSWYNCNRFDEEEARSARTNQEKSRAALQRYLFYCNRYMNHLQSLKFESKLYAMVKEKMEEMQQHNMSWIEVQFLKKAVDILCECRRTLMFTYVFAYYLMKNNQSELFEANQKDLETSTETLSEYLERDISAENLVDIKQKVQDKYRYCDSRRKVLLDHVHEGYDKDWWLYTEADAK